VRIAGVKDSTTTGSILMMGPDARSFHARHKHHGQRQLVAAVVAVLAGVLQSAPDQAQSGIRETVGSSP
jgi:hypothetical protein